MIEIKIVNKDGQKEEFEDNKLFNSVYYPALEDGLPEEDATDLADKAVYEVKAWLSEHEDNVHTSGEVRQKVMEILERENPDVAFLYQTHLDIN